MPGLTDHASGPTPPADPRLEEAHQRWEATMLAEIEKLRAELRDRQPSDVADRVGARPAPMGLELTYWGRPVRIEWPDLVARQSSVADLSAFDQAMLLYHLRLSDGTPPEGRWVAYRELPGGEFYHRAFIGYTGRRLAERFGLDPTTIESPARALAGSLTDGPSPFTWTFAPLPRIPLAVCLWPGDEDFAPQASVLFDSSAAHHLPIDGLALLGAGLTGRLLAAASG